MKKLLLLLLLTFVHPVNIYGQLGSDIDVRNIDFSYTVSELLGPTALADKVFLVTDATSLDCGALVGGGANYVWCASNGSNYIAPYSISGGGGSVASVFSRTGSVVATEGDYSLGQLGDVQDGSYTIDNFLVWNGSGWVSRDILEADLPTHTPASHTHLSSEITSFSSEVRGLLSGGANVSYNSGTGAISVTSFPYGSLTGVPTTFAPSAHTHSASEIASGTFLDARISQTSVTQHEASLSVGWGQLTGIPATFTPSSHTHTESEITDLGTYQVTSEKGANSGYAPLDSSGDVPQVNLPEDPTFSTITTDGSGSGIWRPFLGVPIGNPPATYGDVYVDSDRRIFIRNSSGQNVQIGILHSASDCEAVTGGKAGEVCVDTDDGALFSCVPSVGDCDTAGEWYAQAGGSGGIFTDEGAYYRLTTVKQVHFGPNTDPLATVKITGDAAAEPSLIVTQAASGSGNIIEIRLADDTTVRFSMDSTGRANFSNGAGFNHGGGGNPLQVTGGTAYFYSDILHGNASGQSDKWGDNDPETCTASLRMFDWYATLGTFWWCVEDVEITLEEVAEEIIQMVIYDDATDVTSGDAKARYPIPEEIDGYNLVAAEAWTMDAGLTGDLQIEVNRCAEALTGNACSSTLVNMLTNDLDIDTNETHTKNSSLNATCGNNWGSCINTTNDDVQDGQWIRIDIPAVHSGTAPKGLVVKLTFMPA